MKTHIDLIDPTDAQIEQFAWEAFATAHPHEAYEQDAEKFWAFFHAQASHVTREQMIAMLKETER